jgi:MipA family protein
MILSATDGRRWIAFCLLGLPWPAWATEPAESPTTPEASQTEKPAPSGPIWEGAIGLNTSYRPEYSGAAAQKIRASPGFFFRYGRFSFTNTSGFTTRRADDVARGLGLDLVRDERYRVGLTLRYDGGRRESSSADLTGMGDIDSTVRVRLSMSYRPSGPWRLGGSWSIDALGRGGGDFGDLSLSWSHPLGSRTGLSVNWNLALASERYMQSYYGVSAEQSARSVYPIYDANAGVREAGISLGFRTELGEDWLLLAGIGASRLLGPAARSPLTREPNGWGANLGLAWRF